MKITCKKYIPRFASDMLPGVRLDAWDLVWKSRPKVKFIVVYRMSDLRLAWNTLSKLRGDERPYRMGRGCRGFCHQCWSLFEKDGKFRMEADADYAAVIVVLAKTLSIEVVAHEAFHAGLAVMRRKLRDPNAPVSDLDNEEIAAYPAGKITHFGVKVCRELGLLP
jgi:hypothetical protein